ncbi:hypothetical protein BV898_19877, partial [Hypsibius exemplaris]
MTRPPASELALDVTIQKKATSTQTSSTPSRHQTETSPNSRTECTRCQLVPCLIVRTVLTQEQYTCRGDGAEVAEDPRSGRFSQAMSQRMFAGHVAGLRYAFQSETSIRATTQRSIANATLNASSRSFMGKPHR